MPAIAFTAKLLDLEDALIENVENKFKSSSTRKSDNTF